jgi:hypothetical protein
MASTRKTFLAAAGALSAGVLTGSPVAAQTPSASPSPSPAPSSSARALAQQMKAFDPALTDAQLDEIAQGIDANQRAGASLRKARPLHNGDAPTPEFGVSA